MMRDGCCGSLLGEGDRGLCSRGGCLFCGGGWRVPCGGGGISSLLDIRGEADWGIISILCKLSARFYFHFERKQMVVRTWKAGMLINSTRLNFHPGIKTYT